MAWTKKGESIRKCFVNCKRLTKCKGLLLLQWEMQKANKMDLVAISTGVTFCFLKKKKGRKKNQQQQVLPGAQRSFSNFEKQIRDRGQLAHPRRPVFTN